MTIAVDLGRKATKPTNKIHLGLTFFVLQQQLNQGKIVVPVFQMQLIRHTYIPAFDSMGTAFQTTGVPIMFLVAT